MTGMVLAFAGMLLLFDAIALTALVAFVVPNALPYTHPSKPPTFPPTHCVYAKINPHP